MNEKGYLLWIEYLEDGDRDFIGVFKTKNEAEKEYESQKREFIKEEWFYNPADDTFKQLELHIDEVNIF